MRKGDRRDGSEEKKGSIQAVLELRSINAERGRKRGGGGPGPPQFRKKKKKKGGRKSGPPASRDEPPIFPSRSRIVGGKGGGE